MILYPSFLTRLFVTSTLLLVGIVTVFGIGNWDVGIILIYLSMVCQLFPTED